MKRSLCASLATVLILGLIADRTVAEETRNPFEPAQKSKQLPPDNNTPSLLRYPLSELKLTAIVRNQQGQIFASVEDPHGIGFKVIEGSIIGESRARVTRITTRGIIVEDPSPSRGAGTSLVTREILLHR